jgi:hypothetical protein
MSTKGTPVESNLANNKGESDEQLHADDGGPRYAFKGRDGFFDPGNHHCVVQHVGVIDICAARRLDFALQ